MLHKHFNKEICAMKFICRLLQNFTSWQTTFLGQREILHVLSVIIIMNIYAILSERLYFRKSFYDNFERGSKLWTNNKNIGEREKVVLSYKLTSLILMLHFYSTRKRQKSRCFLTFSGCIEMEHWILMWTGSRYQTDFVHSRQLHVQS